MPLPLAHALVGASIVTACLAPDAPRRTATLLAGAALAITPDFDFIPPWIFGASREWHRGFTHSLGFALLVGVALFLLMGRRRLRAVIALTAGLISHGLLDCLTSIRGGGVELFWPILSSRYKIGLTDLFEPGPGPETVAGLITQLVTSTLTELLIFGPLLVLVLFIRRPRSV